MLRWDRSTDPLRTRIKYVRYGAGRTVKQREYAIGAYRIAKVTTRSFEQRRAFLHVGSCSARFDPIDVSLSYFWYRL